VRLLKGVANLITIAFVTAKISKLEIERRNLEKNLELTGQVQSLLLPHKNNFESEEFSLVGHYQPAEQSGGDWWFFERLHNGSPVIVVGDVTGHGAGPAMVTAIVAGIFQCLTDQLDSTSDLSDVCRTLNQRLVEICQGHYWMTLALVHYSPETGKIRLWSAGAPPVLIHRENGKVEAAFATGSLLGAIDSEFEVGFVEKDLKPGERVLIATDGVFELETPDGQLGMRRTMRIMQSVSEEPSIILAHEKFLTNLETARSGVPLKDDLSYVLLERIK
ncbi:MAG: PP2C family protein-serine/threonine phosphatase, partial [Bdellovibrionales bacterium]